MNLTAKFKKNTFIKNFTALFSATLVAQLINFASSPILTRIYSPEDFGRYSFYMSICALLIVYTTGRYEFAINIAKKETESQLLLKLVILFSTSFVLLIFIGEQFFIKKIAVLFGLDNAPLLFYFIPITLLAMGILQGITYYLNKHKNFTILSKGKVLQSSISSVSSIIFGITGFHSLGLILANVLGIISSVFYQTFAKRLSFLFNIQKYTFVQITEIAKKYRHYPMFNSTSAFFDNLAIQAPVFILMRFFSETIVGFFSLTVRVLGMPISLISTSISQVFLSEIATLNNEGKSFKHVLYKVTKVLLLIGLIPMLFLIILGPAAFKLVFGTEWTVAGEISRILAIGYYAKFVVSPLSVIFFVKQKVKMLSITQFLRAISTLIVLLVSAQFENIYLVVWAYTIHEVLFYCIYFYFIIKVSN